MFVILTQHKKESYLEGCKLWTDILYSKHSRSYVIVHNIVMGGAG
jgi:hypothetical protein